MLLGVHGWMHEATAGTSWVFVWQGAVLAGEGGREVARARVCGAYLRSGERKKKPPEPPSEKLPTIVSI